MYNYFYIRRDGGNRTAPALTTLAGPVRISRLHEEARGTRRNPRFEMKVYISADIEGIAGSTHWHETYSKEAVSGDVSGARLTLPGSFEVELGFKEHGRARRASFYPGASAKDSVTVLYRADDYFDVLRLFQFVLF